MLAIVGFIAIANAEFLFAPEAIAFGVRLQPLIAFPLLLFVPGYVFVSIMFPGKAARKADAGRLRSAANPVNLAERAALSFGLSVAILPLFALLLSLTVGFSFRPALALFSGLILVGLVVGTIRRIRLPAEEQFSVPLGQWGREAWSRVFYADSPIDASLNSLLALAILSTIAAAVIVVGAPAQGESFSTIYLATENPDGGLETSGYPTEFTAGEAQTLTVAVENSEGERTAYTIVVMLERLQPDGDVAIAERQSIAQFNPSVNPGETWTLQHSIAPTLTGEDLRLHYYLYRGDSAPETPTTESAYRDVFVWIDVAPR